MQLVIVARYDQAFDAHLSKNLLENEGIDSFIFDEHIVGVNPLYNLTVGGIKLMVAEADLNAAKAILKTSTEIPLKNDDGNVISCPNCNSTSIDYKFKSMKGFKGFLALIISLFTLSYPLYYKHQYKCNDCGHVFEPVN